MPKKYYAVKVGHQPGVYDTWAEAKRHIDGFPRAVYKSFTSKKEAENFIRVDDFDWETPHSIFYTDGSFKDGKAGFAVLRMTEEMEDFCYGGVPSKFPPTNNVAELYAIGFLLSHYDDDPLEIRTDSMLVVNLFVHQYKPQANLELVEQIKTLLRDRKVRFVHIYGHRDDRWNIKVDELANEGRIVYG